MTKSDLRFRDLCFRNTLRKIREEVKAGLRFGKHGDLQGALRRIDEIAKDALAPPSQDKEVNHARSPT